MSPDSCQHLFYLRRYTYVYTYCSCTCTVDKLLLYFFLLFQNAFTDLGFLHAFQSLSTVSLKLSPPEVDPRERQSLRHKQLHLDRTYNYKVVTKERTFVRTCTCTRTRTVVHVRVVLFCFSAVLFLVLIKIRAVLWPHRRNARDWSKFHLRKREPRWCSVFIYYGSTRTFQGSRATSVKGNPWYVDYSVVLPEVRVAL